jgi:hypothetical protein
MTAPNDKRAMPYGGAFAVQDPDVIAYIKKLNLTNSLWEDNITGNFCSAYKDWIITTNNNTISGLENFKYPVFSNGTSQSFDMFYMKNNNRRFRCFKGEYIYHQLAWRNNWPDWKFIEDEKLDRNDAVVISLPFSNTGNVHNDYEFIMHTCSALGIPVLIDCVYFGACANINFNFSHNCITDIVFSLSKSFPVAHARIGMRLTRSDDDDLMLVYDKINYNNRISAKLGLELIKRFSPDFTYNRYILQQQSLCSELNVTPSNTVLFGLDYNNAYPEYNRGGTVNRLGLHKHL